MITDSKYKYQNEQSFIFISTGVEQTLYYAIVIHSNWAGVMIYDYTQSMITDSKYEYQSGCQNSFWSILFQLFSKCWHIYQSKFSEHQLWFIPIEEKSFAWLNIIHDYRFKTSMSKFQRSIHIDSWFNSDSWTVPSTRYSGKCKPMCAQSLSE